MRLTPYQAYKTPKMTTEP